MNRKIKFRAFLKANKLMYHVLTLDIAESKALIEHGDMRGYAKYPEECELMQYTGVKDKNGKEIYEGDIVGLNNGHKYKVIYDDTRFIGVNSIGVCYVDSCYMNGSSRIEVIGNIYENEEMLKNE